MIGCPCRICVPGELTDPVDLACVADVQEHGWRVMLVDAGAREDQPAFAYTVGLTHQADHPELVISGLPFELMHHVLNDLGRRVTAGFPLAAGDLVEGALARVPLVVDPMSPAGIAESVTWSRWFHRRDVDALQVVWPEPNGVFAWQLRGHEELDVIQPQRWRLPQERTGAVARKPEWLMPSPPDRVAFVCKHVAEQGEPVLSIVRDQSESWQVLCDADHSAAGTEAVMIHLEHIARMSPAAAALDLKPGDIASRPAAWLPWVRGRV